MPDIVGWRLVPLEGRDRTSGQGRLCRGSCGVPFAIGVVGVVLTVPHGTYVNDCVAVLADNPTTFDAVSFEFADVSAAWARVLHEDHLRSLSCRKYRRLL